jgi:Mce-associated membrane protein
VTTDKKPVKKKSAIAEAALDDAVDAEDTVDVEDAGDASPGRLKRITGRLRKRPSGKLIPAVLALLVVVSLSLLGGLFYFWYLPDRDVNDAAAKAAVAAASEGTVAVLSYSPETLEHDFSSAKSHLTGGFLSYYEQFTQNIVGPAAKMKSVKTTAVVLRAALADFHADSAVVLLFVNQSTQSGNRPEPAYSSSSVTVKLTKADGKWLISSFDPVTSGD